MAPGDTIQCGTDESSWWNDWSVPGCTDPQSVAGAIVDGVIGDAWVQDFKNGVSDVVKTLVTFWISVPDPQLQDNGATSEAVSFLSSKLTWLAAILMCFLIAFQVGRMFLGHWKEGAQMIVGMVVTYFGVLLLALPLIVISLTATTAVAKWILDEATIGTSFGDNLFSLFNNSAGITSTIALCALLLLGILLGAFQCFIMIGRSGALVVLVGSLVFSAASTASETGKAAFDRTRSWIIALILYKLVAAAIYGVGFRFLGTDVDTQDNGMLQIFYGLTLLIMGIIALPATIRLVAPAAEPVSGGRGIGATAASGMAIAGGTIMRRAA